MIAKCTFVPPKGSEKDLKKPEENLVVILKDIIRLSADKGDKPRFQPKKSKLMIKKSKSRSTLHKATGSTLKRR